MDSNGIDLLLADSGKSFLVKLLAVIASHSTSHFRTTGRKKRLAIRYGFSWILADLNGF